MNEAYLEHVGVKGMKWGVRKERTVEQQQKHDHRMEVVKAGAKAVAIGGTIAIGVGLAAYALKKNGKVSPSTLKVSRKHQLGDKAVGGIMNKVGKNRVKDLKTKQNERIKELFLKEMATNPEHALVTPASLMKKHNASKAAFDLFLNAKDKELGINTKKFTNP